ncbi:MAG TPA: D-aminoacyl-tRNA deacylase [candidate division Zixibacteria bacterium]|nr:D-aminoacyl-tRNA deacylase [candidate division Zixibacteria bacterium]
MRIVAQRVHEASVTVEQSRSAAIGTGLCIFLGVGRADNESDACRLADKVKNLRVFEDAEGKMNLSVADVGGAVLVISQFTLYGDCRKGNRPSFTEAAPPQVARPLYEAFVRRLRESGIEVATGEFGARMRVRLTNDGPVTLLLES